MTRHIDDPTDYCGFDLTKQDPVEQELTADDVLATHKFVLSPTRNPGWGEPDNHMVYVEKTDDERRETLAKYTAQQNRAFVKRLCEGARDELPLNHLHASRLDVWNACCDHIERMTNDG